MQELLKRLEKIREYILPQTESLMQEHREEIYYAIETVFATLHAARYEGFSGVERIIREIKKNEIIPLMSQEYAEVLNELMERPEIDYLLEKMLEEYDTTERNAFEDFIRYLMMRSMMLLLNGNTDRIAKAVCWSMLPPKERRK
ncbi:MAG: hypothetical protein J6A75_02655 [Lachnospiraceae bacterium]|nr:hypothetical protein [Lachnospiraceae bacterium]